MRKRVSSLLALPLLAIAFLSAPPARADYKEFSSVPADPEIQTKLREVVEETLKEHPKLTADNLAITFLDVSKQNIFSRGDVQGDAPFYPASVVKVFYMLETFHQVSKKQIELTPETQRALHEMIAVSDNDATAYILDLISDTSSGPELEGRALQKFLDKRRVVNRYLQSLGYENVSAMAKPWSFGPFGRDMQLLGPNRENRNKATANSVAALLYSILRGKAVSPEMSGKMAELLARPLAPPRPEENQVKEFIGAALPPGAKIWSKAGWTTEVRHDAAYVELPSGRKFILVIFTRGTADDVTLIPSITTKVLARLGNDRSALITPQ